MEVVCGLCDVLRECRGSVAGVYGVVRVGSVWGLWVCNPCPEIKASLRSELTTAITT